MGNFYSKFRQLYQYSPTVSMMALATFLYFYIFHGLPKVWRKKPLRAKRRNPWGKGVGRRIGGIVGLKNFGNTCYFNACIQAMAACGYFYTWIERRNTMNEIQQNKRKDTTDDNANELNSDDEETPDALPFPVIAALYEAFTLINAKTLSRDPCLSEMIPSKLIAAFTAHNLEAVKNNRMRRFVLNSHEEQDTHEAFNYILETIGDECSNRGKVYHSSTNLALNDTFCADEVNIESPTASPPFCKLTRKSADTSLAAPGTSALLSPSTTVDAAGDTAQYGDFVDCDEEEEPNSSATSSSFQKQRSFHIVRPTAGGDTISKGKLSNKDWFGGHIVSRTEIHETDIREDTLMTQNISFDGTLGLKLACIACGTPTKPRLEKFNCLTVTIPRNVQFGGQITLEDLILYSLKPIQVHGVDCSGCSDKFGKNTTSTFVQYTALGRMPPNLCIHISRTEWTNEGACIKRGDHVKFPIYLNIDKFRRITDLLNHRPTMKGVPTYGELSKIVEAKPGKLRPFHDFDYSLKAVICHHGGSAEAGHYTTYRESSYPTASGSSWYNISDCTISSVSMAEVMSCTAYMLFYERKRPMTRSMINLPSSFK